MKHRGWLLLIALSSSYLYGQGTDADKHGAKELFFSLQPDSIDVTPLQGGIISPIKRSRPAQSQSRPSPRGHSQTSQARSSEALALRYWIELVGPTTSSSDLVTESRVFKSGEKIRLHFSSSTGGYISLAQRTESGGLNLLFPRPKKGYDDPRIKPSVDRVLPGEAATFQFDNKPSNEKLLIIFAKDPQKLSTVLDAVEKSHTSTEQLAESRLGSKDLVLEVEDSQNADVGTYLVSRDGGAVVQEVILKHEG